MYRVVVLVVVLLPWTLGVIPRVQEAATGYTVVPTSQEVRLHGYIICDDGYEFIQGGMFFIMESDIISDDVIAKMKFPMGKSKAKFDFNLTISDGFLDPEAEVYFMFSNVCKQDDVHRFADVFGRVYNVTPHPVPRNEHIHFKDDASSGVNSETVPAVGGGQATDGQVPDTKE